MHRIHDRAAEARSGPTWPFTVESRDMRTIRFLTNCGGGEEKCGTSSCER
jgi:hypothetical protein